MNLDTANTDSWQLLVTVLWPFVQEWIKNSPFPWLTQATKKLNIFISALVATIATAGFHFSGGVTAKGGSLTLTIPPLVVLGHVAAQWLGQHFVYQTAIKSPVVQQAILAELQKLTTEK